MFRNQNSATVNDCFMPSGGAIWQQLHAERERVCEGLLNRFIPIDESSREIENHRIELLQLRLCRIDNALDRLMAGSYGICSECGKHIESERLTEDPAASYCQPCRAEVEH